MSHYCVLIRIPEATHTTSDFELESTLEAMLLPYKEAGFGDSDPPELKAFLEFEDCEDENRNKYEMQGRTLYATFEEYMADHCGYKSRDPQTGRYGSWRNPNQKWDWYVIGGRWNGYLPNDSNATIISELGQEALAAQQKEAATGFHAEFQEFLAGKEYKFFEGPRDRLLKLGIVRCIDLKDATGSEFKVIPWIYGKDDPRASTPRCDVIDRNYTLDEFLEKFESAFYPIMTWAYLDTTGWHEPGEMGWWAFSDDTPETYMAHRNGFKGWLLSGNQQDLVVVVDCHI